MRLVGYVLSAMRLILFNAQSCRCDTQCRSAEGRDIRWICAYQIIIEVNANGLSAFTLSTRTKKWVAGRCKSIIIRNCRAILRQFETEHKIINPGAQE